jgi:uncharacterized membrane protein (DUF485 family)
VDNIRKDASYKEPNRTDWNQIAASAEFRHLLSLKKLFIVPAFLFFFVYYFALPVAVGFAPRLMSTNVIGNVTLAYLFALSQFVVGGIIAWLYLKASAKFDALTRDLLKKFDASRGEN